MIAYVFPPFVRNPSVRTIKATFLISVSTKLISLRKTEVPRPGKPSGIMETGSVRHKAGRSRISALLKMSSLYGTPRKTRKI